MVCLVIWSFFSSLLLPFLYRLLLLISRVDRDKYVAFDAQYTSRIARFHPDPRNSDHEARS